MLLPRASAGQVPPRSFIHPPHGSHPSFPKFHCYHSLLPEHPKQTPCSKVVLDLNSSSSGSLHSSPKPPQCFACFLLDWFYLAAPLCLISDVCPHFQPTSVHPSFSLFLFFPPSPLTQDTLNTQALPVYVFPSHCYKSYIVHYFLYVSLQWRQCVKSASCPV